MSDSENYLDQLLHSVNGGGAKPSSNSHVQKSYTSPENSGVSFDDEVDLLAAYERDMGSADDDFLAEFERDMGMDSQEDAFAASGKKERKKAKKAKKERKSIFKKKESASNSLMAELDETLSESRGDFDSFDNMSEFVPEDVNDDDFDINPNAEPQPVAEPQPAAEPQPDPEPQIDPEPQAAPEPQSEPEAEFEVDDDPMSMDDVSSIPEEIPLTEDGEPDLGGIDGENLMDMLSGTEGMEDIGDLLSKDETGDSVEGKDSIGEFAEKEMSGEGGTSAEATEAEEESGKKKKKKDKKEKGEKGFFAKLLEKLFHDPEEDDKLDISPVEGSGVEELSEENLALLRELEDVEKPAEGDASADDKKKKKEKKPKKEKKKKEPKPKKPPKPKKEKKPKEPDNSPKLNKKGVAVLFVLVASMLAGVLLINSLGNYSTSMKQAKRYYQRGLYIEAYMEVEGINVKNRDVELYNKIVVMSSVYSQYHDYLVFSNQNMTVNAFDALVCAAGRYNSNLAAAEEYGCTQEMNNLGLDIIAALSDNYGMTMDEAEEMYANRNRATYTLLLHQKLRELGLE